MSELLTFAGQRATACVAYGAHRPRPARFVWHHVLPQTCGGLTVKTNLIQVCDNCHYTIHAVMWALVNSAPVPFAAPGQLAFARRGVAEATAAGTQARMPKEAAGA